ncbi:guanylate kinase [Collinsella provencensis]|uniref:guanylate kinase n=1 Tax=Collinsella provencensis TaxID=1937461 RepID=UPI000C846A61|nr:guanylate kinase [Collinsella provencensis]
MSLTEPKLFVISGPSGAGKGTLVARVRAVRTDLGLTVSATTREPRAGEIDGVNYYFLTDDEFSARIEAGDFVEWAQVHDHRYGTLASEVDRNLATGQSLILEIDVQGALAVKERFPEAVLIFIEPPSLEVLRERLIGRGSETPESLALRLHTAESEMQLRDRYDDIVVNDDLDRATDELLVVLNAHERNAC